MTDLPKIAALIEDAICDSNCHADCDAYRGPNGTACASCEAQFIAGRLVASGWRPEVDVRAEIAAPLRAAAEGRREYAGNAPPDAATMLHLQSSTLDAAALVAEGDLQPMYGWLPSWRWTDEMTAKLHGDRATALEPSLPLPVADGSEVDVRITPAVSRTFAAPVTFYESDEPVADVQAAFEMGEKGVTNPPAGAPQCTCPLIDTSSAPMKPEFVRGDPAGCKVHGQKRDAEIEAAKRRARG